MKRIVAALLIIGCLAGCEMPTEVDRTPVDARYTAASVEFKTNYHHKYSWLRGEFVLVPDVRQVTVPEKWEIQYRVTYDNGYSCDEWKECSREEYERFVGTQWGGTDNA